MNKYLKEHHSKYYYDTENQEPLQKSVNKLSKSAGTSSKDSYDFTIGRTKSVSDPALGAEQIVPAFDDFDQVRYFVVINKFLLLSEGGSLFNEASFACKTKFIIGSKRIDANILAYIQ